MNLYIDSLNSNFLRFRRVIKHIKKLNMQKKLIQRLNFKVKPELILSHYCFLLMKK